MSTDPGPGALHLWVCRPPGQLPVAVEQTMLGWLDGDERTRFGRLRGVDDRVLFLQAHAFVRCVLAAYAGVGPGDCQFERDPGGRPGLASPTLARLEFSLTHTRGLVACLVSGAGACGVDAEAVDATRSIAALSGAALTEAEQRVLAALPPGERQERFFELWTLKEAYVKARGLGLGVPFSWISLRLAPDGAVIAALHPDLADDPSQWQVRVVPVGSAHRLAVAVCSPGPVEITVPSEPPRGWPLVPTT